MAVCAVEISGEPGIVPNRPRERSRRLAARGRICTKKAQNDHARRCTMSSPFGLAVRDNPGCSGSFRHAIYTVKHLKSSRFKLGNAVISRAISPSRC
eukprot:scaffold5042_cov37-Phaeocystis_antarctica.AAC.1